MHVLSAPVHVTSAIQYGPTKRLWDYLIELGIAMLLVVFSLKKRRWALNASIVWHILAIVVWLLLLSRVTRPFAPVPIVITSVYLVCFAGVASFSFVLLRALKRERESEVGNSSQTERSDARGTEETES